MSSSMSRRLRRKLLYLAYCVCAKEAPHCRIKPNSLRFRYPDTNYSPDIYVATRQQALDLQTTLQEAFERRGYTFYGTNIWKDETSRDDALPWIVDLGLFHQKEA